MTQPPYGGGYPQPYPPQQAPGGYAPQGYPQGGGYPAPGGYAPPQPGYPQQPPQAPQQVALPSADDFFSGGGSGAPSFDFKGVNHGLIGIITHQQVRQRTKMGSNEKLWNKDGSPQVQLEVTLQTSLRNWQDVKNVPTGEDGQTPLPPQADTGLRRIYVWYKMRDAVQQAVATAGAKHLEIGGELGVMQTGTEPNPQGGNPIRTYRAKYTPPAPATDPGAAAFFGQPAPQQVPQAPPQAPPQQQYAPAPPAPLGGPQPGPAQQFQQAMAQQQYAPAPQYAPQPDPAAAFAQPVPPGQQAAEPPF